MVIHRVVIVVPHIIAVMRKLRTAIPEVVSHVKVVVVDACVDDGHHNTCSRVAQLPHLVGTNLQDILRDFARGESRMRCVVLRNPVIFFCKADDFNVVATSKVLDGRFRCIEIHGIRHPQNGGLRHHAIAFHLGERMAKVVLRIGSEVLQLVHHKFAAFGTRGKVVGTTVELCTVVLRFHNHNNRDVFLIAAASHFLTQQRVNDSLCKAAHAEQHRKKKE